LPLKSPIDLPKIPKTRKKKAEAAINAIPEKKPDRLEYICKTSFQYDSPLKKQFFVIAIETIAEFTSFAYEVVVDYFKERNEVFIVLMGLKAKTNMVPKIQPARSDIYLKDLTGELTINVVKQDGSINSGIYKLNIFSKEITLLKEFKPIKKNNRMFCKFEVAENEFSFPKT